MMGTWRIRLALGVLAAAAWAAAWPATGVAEEKAPGGADAPKADETAAAKFEKQILNIEDRMKNLQQEEFRASMATVKAQGVADGADIEKYRQELEKGSKKKEHLEYRAALEAAAAQWWGLAEKYERIISMLKGLERDREKASADMQAKGDELTKRAQDKYRSFLEKAVSCCSRCADYKNALRAELSLYQSTPEANRDLAMKKELADLYKKAGDTKNAVALYKGILDAIPEKDRFKDRKLVEEIANFSKSAGDFRTTLLLYKGLWEAIPEKDRGKDGGLGRTLAELYEKVGDLRGALLVYKAIWEAVPEKDRAKDWGLGEKIGDVCEKAGDPKSALQIYQMCYDAMPDNEKKDKKKGVPLNAKIQMLRAKLGVPSP